MAKMDKKGKIKKMDNTELANLMLNSKYYFLLVFQQD